MKQYHIKKYLVLGLFVLFAAGLNFVLYGEAEAKVRGVCSNCHTMHNSQDGNSMVLQSVPTAGAGTDCTGCHSEPRENLLRLDCIGCHAMNLAGPAITQIDTYDVPQVYYAEVANRSMAAGNFYYLSLDDAFGHNIHGFTTALIPPEFVMPDPNVPPGYVRNMDPGNPKFEDWTTASSPVPEQILCAGAYGCHGSRKVESQTQAMQGTHHAEDEPVLQLGTKAVGTVGQGLTPGTSYRFLSGVKGGEVSDWEWTASTTSHNEYYGKTLTGTRTSQSSVETMSEFCASCHGNFHQYTNDTSGDGIGYTGSSPWIRHPTDIELPNSGEFASYVSYDLTAPIARTVVPADADPDARSSGTAIVFCLSCHRAHASENWDSLRFSYSDMVIGQAGAGAGEGCFSCHSDKDGI